MQEIKGSRPTGCVGIVKALLAAMLFATAGCAQLPRMDSPPSVNKVEQLGTADTFSAPASAWPGDRWWQAYGDPQLNGLIEEALQGAPDLKLAQARLAAAGAVVRSAESTHIPEVTGSAAITEQKQSYNYLFPRQTLPSGWTDYGLATLNFSWELDFWGKNRSALAAALSDREAAGFEYAETRLLLSTSVAAAYAGLVDLYTLRDNAAETLKLREETVKLFRQRHDFGLETLASVRQVEARRASAEAELLSYDERIGLQGNAIAALLGAGPDRALAITRPSTQFANSTGLPANLAADLLGRRPDILAARSRTEAAAHRIDEKKAGFYPSVNLVAFVGLQSLGVGNLTDGGISGRLGRPGRVAADFQHAPFAGRPARRARRIRCLGRHLQRDAHSSPARGGGCRHEPQGARWGASGLTRRSQCRSRSPPDRAQAVRGCAGDLSRCAGGGGRADLRPAGGSRARDPRSDSRCELGARTRWGLLIRSANRLDPPLQTQ